MLANLDRVDAISEVPTGVAELAKLPADLPEIVGRTVIDIGAGGRIAFVWDDRLADLAGEGDCRVTRASHVEPEEGRGTGDRGRGTGDGGQETGDTVRPYGTGERLRWIADLRPVGGPVLGPFLLRGEALAAEREWLEERDLLELEQLAENS